MLHPKLLRCRRTELTSMLKLRRKLCQSCNVELSGGGCDSPQLSEVLRCYVGPVVSRLAASVAQIPGSRSQRRGLGFSVERPGLQSVVKRFSPTINLLEDLADVGRILVGVIDHRHVDGRPDRGQG